MTLVTGVILAAGSGTRMGRPKAEIELGGQRLVDRAVRSMAVCDELLVVLRSAVRVEGARTVVNPAPDRGMRSSLQLALEQVGEPDAVAVMLVDLPGITAADVAAVVCGWRRGRIAIGSFAGRWGHPTVMGPADWWAAAQLAGPDEGARRYLLANSDRIDEVPVSGDPVDVDRPQDLQAWAEGRSD